MTPLRIAASLLALLAPGVAAAQSARTFVSGNGSDSNPCTVAAPCRSFAQALNVTNAGGEILVLDSAGYGTLTINKSVSIISPTGIYGGITVPANGTGIAVTGDPVVVLRGLSVNGAGVGGTGISIAGGGTVEVHDCLIRGFAQNGISISGRGKTFIADTIVSGNAAAAVYMRATSSGSTTVSMSRVKLLNNDKGFQANGGNAAYGFATMDSSVVSENGSGVYITTDTGSANEVSLFSSNSAIQNNSTSVVVGAGALLKLQKTSIVSNFYQGGQNNGTIVSFGDNAIYDTITGNAFTARALR